jgi:GntR family transcriptional repressor for pyruvate dehydrogenase complex
MQPRSVSRLDLSDVSARVAFSGSADASGRIDDREVVTASMARVAPRYELSDIRPIGPGRVAERVVEEIREYITANGLEPGHKLPPEREFIERLGVSRSSVREGLRVLSALGLIDVRHGDGMYVATKPETLTASRSEIFDATEEHALRNLIETRFGVEMAAVSAAALRASDDDFDQLEQLLDEQEAALSTDPGYAWEPLSFELLLCEITGNSWLYDIESMLKHAWLTLSMGLRSSVGRHQEWLHEHRAILASLRSRNVSQAQRLVMAHVSLERFEEDLRQRGALPSKSRNEPAQRGTAS